MHVLINVFVHIKTDFMKKIMLLFVAAGALSTMPAYSQGLYVKLGAGYALPMGNQEFLANDLTVTGTSINETQVRTSYGKGFIPTLGVGYMFNEFIGIEVAASYLLGSATEAEQSGPLLPGVDNMTINASSKATGINLLPALKLQAPLNEKLQLYSRTGLVVPLGGKIITDITSSVTQDGLTSNTDQTREVKGNMTVGLAGALGLNIAINDRLSVWAEANGQMLNVWAKSAEVTAMSVDGADILSSLSVSNKQIEFVKELNASGNNDYNPNGINESLPYEQLSEQVSFHNIGLAIGVAFHF